jgi:hypothetical protein
MSDNNQECSASTPPFFYAAIYRDGKVEIVAEDNVSDWVRRHDKGENRNDGLDHLIIHPRDTSHSEFSSKTSVFWVNGINTPFLDEVKNATEYAKKIHHDVQIIHASTHGLPSDLLQVAEEKLLPFQNSWRNAPEQSVAMEVLRRIEHDGNGLRFKEDRIHFASHSRGALIVERGLEFVREYLRELQYPDTQIYKISSHITSATFEGASYKLLDGARSVNITNSDDPVSMFFGVGRSDDGKIPDAQGNVSQTPTYVPAPHPRNIFEMIPLLNIAHVHDVESAIKESPPSWEDTYQAASQPELLKHTASPKAHAFTATVLDVNGIASLKSLNDEHFKERGKILAIDTEHIVQSPAFGVLVWYKTDDLLRGMNKPEAEAALHRLQEAAAAHEEVNLSRDDHGLIINGMREKIAEAVKSEVGKAMKQGREVGEARAREHIFRFLHPNEIRGTYNGKELLYHPGEINRKGLIIALDEKKGYHAK